MPAVTEQRNILRVQSTVNLDATVESNAYATQARMVTALCCALEQATASPVRLIQTHISYVLLTGRYAYKIKKAVTLGFLDFASLAARLRYCEQELRLNRRFAPALYRRVVPITGSVESPQLDGHGAALEYGVEMVEFPQQSLLCNLLERGELSSHHIDRLAATIAAVHANAEPAAAGADLDSAPRILERALENFAQLRPLVTLEADRQRLDAIERWTRREHSARCHVFEQRKATGRVRDCHGDLHLGNALVLGDQVVLFDCIEFNDELRIIDVLSEIAFTVMDLEARGHPWLAHRLRNAYLEITGDYEGIAVLRFYLVYRAMVRAKIAAIRGSQLPAGAARAASAAECSKYLMLAFRHSLPVRGGVIITHGFSGSGKTTLSQHLLEEIGAIRLRSDVERKRMHGAPPLEPSHSRLNAGLYAKASTDATYDRLVELAACTIDAGYVAIVDATFLERSRRATFVDLAACFGVPFAIVSFQGRAEALRRRIAERQRQHTDASEANLDVLEDQLRNAQPLESDEVAHAIQVDVGEPIARAALQSAWEKVKRLLAVPAVGTNRKAGR